jgi:hypothetical protein
MKSAPEMVRWFGAIQGQEYAQTKWALGLRLPHMKDADIEKDFNEGKIIRTHLLRPTWHFVSAQDIRWMLALTGPRVHAINDYMYRQLGLDSKVFNSCIRIMEKILQGGKQLTRDAINEEFLKNKIIAKGHRLSYIMMYAELGAVICSGARQGNQFTYALLEERVPASDLLSIDEALEKLTGMYFTSRGPATIRDFSTWSGLTMADCRKGLEMTESHLVKEVIEAQTYYFPGNINLKSTTYPEISLLPVYDEFIMGYKDRSAIFQLRKSLKPDLPFYDCMIVYDGQIIGTWKRTILKESIIMQCQFFRPLNKNQRNRFDKAIRRFETFTDKAVNIVFL